MKTHPLGFRRIKVVALAVDDPDRAHRFYRETLALEPAYDGDQLLGYTLGDIGLMLKTGWYGTPTDQPNPRFTIEVDHAPATEQALRARGVTITDPVSLYDEKFLIGSFLDSEGNKLWFCSPAEAVS